LLPLFLTLEFTEFKLLFPLLPFVNALFIFILTAGIFLFHNQRNPETLPGLALNNNILWNTFFSKNFLPPFILYVAVVISIVTAYYPLPDLDPYYWITEYRAQFQAEIITALHGHRPFFSSLTYIFTQGAHIDFYAYFKYVLPSLLILLIFPSALLAQKFPNSLHKTIIFFFPFASGITIIFLTLPIPQAIANLGLFFFFSFLVYALLTKDSFFYFLGGAVLFLSFFYHEALAIPLALWILISLWSYRQPILEKVRGNRLTTLLLLFILLPVLYGPLMFIVVRTESFLPALLNSHPNLLFPQYYVNIDGNQMGWGDLFGVAKYYLFYIGPPLLLTFLATLYYVKNKILRSFLFSREGIVLTSVFFTFFIIAEILPRLTGIALLPDRAWVFAGTIALFFLIAIFSLPIGKNRFFLWLIILGFTLNIAAAVYINTLKKYMITDQQLASAEWISANIPQNSTVFSFENGKLLTFFASNTHTIFIQNPNFYFDREIFETEYRRFTNRKTDQTDQYQSNLREVKKNISQLERKNIESDTQEILSLVNSTSDLLVKTNILANSALSQDTTEVGPFYIYYAAPNPKNPYLDRPYNKQLVGEESAIIFNQFPDQFKLIYSNEKEKIYIWKIL
jgi:hypothetical protein